MQVSPESEYKEYWACPVFVKKIDGGEDIIEGYIIVPDKRGTDLIEIKVPMDDVEYLMTPHWMPEQCLKARERME